MPPGSKKRKAAKKKQQQQQEASSPQIKPNNHESRKEDDVRIKKEPGLDNDERIEITDSSRDHDKNSSSSSSSGSSSNSSDDESSEVKKNNDDKEASESVITVTSVVPNQPIPIAGDAPFMGSTANVIVESFGLMDSTTPGDPNTEKMIEIAPVDTVIPTKNEESSLPKPNEITAQASLASDEIKQASSSATYSDKKENKGKALTLPEGSKESEATSSHEEEAPARPTHGVAQRTSWLSCCGLFDVVTGSTK